MPFNFFFIFLSFFFVFFSKNFSSFADQNRRHLDFLKKSKKSLENQMWGPMLFFSVFFKSVFWKNSSSFADQIFGVWKSQKKGDVGPYHFSYIFIKKEMSDVSLRQNIGPHIWCGALCFLVFLLRDLKRFFPKNPDFSKKNAKYRSFGVCFCQLFFFFDRAPHHPVLSGFC